MISVNYLLELTSSLLLTYLSQGKVDSPISHDLKEIEVGKYEMQMWDRDSLRECLILGAIGHHKEAQLWSLRLNDRFLSFLGKACDSQPKPSWLTFAASVSPLSLSAHKNFARITCGRSEQITRISNLPERQIGVGWGRKGVGVCSCV
jgi:hypothetical protein